MARVPPRSSAASAGSTRSPTGANKIAASSGSGGMSAAAADRGGAELAGELLGLLAAGQHVDGGALGERDLGGQVRAAAEAVQAEAAARRQLGPLQRVVADDARAQQRSQLQIGVALRQPVRVRRRDGQVVGVAAVGVPAGVPRVRAQVLQAARRRTCTADRSSAARPRRPGPRPAKLCCRCRRPLRFSPRPRPRRPPRGRASRPAGAAAGRPRSRAGRCGTRRRPGPSAAAHPGPAPGRHRCCSGAAAGR